MKTAISVPDEVFEAAEQLAKRLGVSRSELYSTAVEGFLEEHRSKGVTALLNTLYRDESSALDQEVERLQASSLPEGAW